MKTQAVVFSEEEKFEFREISLPEPGERDIAVRTLVTAVSPGTERWILKGKHAGTRYPLVPGYHRIGVVDKCGKKAGVFKEGDIVYGFSGRWNEDINSMWGAHSGYTVSDWMEYSNNPFHRFLCSSMPSANELEIAAFTVVAAVAHKGIRFLNPCGGEKMLIIGAGFIGLCAAQLGLLRDAVPVLIDIDEEKLGFARQMGFTGFNPVEHGFDDKLKDFSGEGFTIIYDTAGMPDAIDMAVGYTKRWSRMLLQAQYFDKEHKTIDLDAIKMKEMTIKTTVGIDNMDFDAAYSDIMKRRLRIDPLITHRFKPANFLEAYNLLLKGEPFNLGMVCDWTKT